MSASYFGGEVKYTKRYRIGQQLGWALPPFPAHDGDAAQRQGRGLSALHGAARRRPFRGPLPRRRPLRRYRRHDAAADEGRAASLRCAALVSRTARLYRQVRVVARGSRTLCRRHRLCPNRDEPSRAVRRDRRQETEQCRLRPADPAAPAGVLAGRDPPVAQAAAGTARTRACRSQARREGPGGRFRHRGGERRYPARLGRIRTGRDRRSSRIWS